MSKTNESTPEKCSNLYIQAMLVPYAERSLAKHNRTEVEHHLEECDICRAEVRRVQQLLGPLNELSRSGLRPDFEDHPDEAQLYAYAFEQNTLTREQLRKLRVHIFMCGNCQREIDMLKGVESDFLSRVSLGWQQLVLPPAIRELFASKNEDSDSEEWEAPEVSPLDQLQAIFQKFNLRLGLMVAGALLLLLCGLSVMTCSGEATQEPQALATPQATASAPAADRVIFIDAAKAQEARNLLNVNKINFTSGSTDRLTVAAQDGERAVKILKEAGYWLEKPVPVSETAPANEENPQIGEPQTYQVESDEAKPVEETGVNTSEENPDTTQAEPDVGSESPTTSADEVSVSSASATPNGSAAPDVPPQKSEVAPRSHNTATTPVHHYSQPRVSASAPRRYTAVKSYPRSAPRAASTHSSTRPAAPKHTYQPAAPAVHQSAPPPAHPVPLAIPRHSAPALPAVPRNAAPTPAIIRPGVDNVVTSQAVPLDSEANHSRSQSQPDLIESKETIE